MSARTIGLIANPFSGKDIRRVVAQATVVPNHEKINILRRALLGIAGVGADLVLTMPDTGSLASRAAEGLDLPFAVRELEIPLTGSAADTTAAARAMGAAGARCIIVLGGDGTCRAAALGAGNVPLLPISTGTNNAFPLLIEGTLAGMAAAATVASNRELATSAPMLELLRDGQPADLALVDVAALSGDLGARAVWQIERLQLVITTRLTPGTVGLSSLGGAIGAEGPADALAVAIWLDRTAPPERRTLLAPVAPGMVARLAPERIQWLRDGDRLELPPRSALALDGEREHLTRDEPWSLCLRASGPHVVTVEAALQALYQERMSHG